MTYICFSERIVMDIRTCDILVRITMCANAIMILMWTYNIVANFCESIVAMATTSMHNGRLVEMVNPISF